MISRYLHELSISLWDIDIPMRSLWYIIEISMRSSQSRHFHSVCPPSNIFPKSHHLFFERPPGLGVWRKSALKFVPGWVFFLALYRMYGLQKPRHAIHVDTHITGGTKRKKPATHRFSRKSCRGAETHQSWAGKRSRNDDEKTKKGFGADSGITLL